MIKITTYEHMYVIWGNYSDKNRLEYDVVAIGTDT
jgi:hypothetical protein